MYYSQYKQDKYLNEEIFFGKKNGVFLDIGAYDGVTISNTYFFEKFLNWSGICIEPNCDVFRLLEKNRISKNFKVALSNTFELDLFLKLSGYTEMLSGLLYTYDYRHLDRIINEIDTYGGNYNYEEVYTSRLDFILNICDVSYIDFCSIDVEGSELQVLKGLDFSKVVINYFVIENNYKTEDVFNFMKDQGYNKIKEIEIDEVYQFMG